MKRTYNVLILLSGLVIFSGCTKTLYTHQEVLQNCRTKDDVLKQFGVPDEKNPGQGIEQWVYNMDKPAVKKSKKQDIVQNHPDALVKDSIQYATQEKYTKYVKFIFDEQGNVTGYKAEGVDLTRSVKDSFGKSLLTVTGGVLIISGWLALELYKDGAFQ